MPNIDKIETITLNQKQASKMLGIAPATLKEFTLKGIIPYKKLGEHYLYSRQALEDWLSCCKKNS